MTKDTTKIRQEIATELCVSEQSIGPVRQIQECLYFRVNGRGFTAMLTRTGFYKRNSCRVG